MNKLCILYIPFWKDWKLPQSPAPSHKGYKRIVPIKNDWARYRLEFMQSHTLKSVSNQTKPFDYVFIYVEPYYRDIVEKWLSSNPLPESCQLLSQPLPEILHNKEFSHLCITRLDSDDLIHKDVCKEVSDAPTSVRTLLYQDGFAFDIETSHLCRYVHPSPPFYTHTFSKNEVDKMIDIPIKSHMQSQKGMRKLLSPGKFVVMCHKTEYQCTSQYAKLKSIANSNQHLKSTNVYIPQTLSDFGCDIAISKYEDTENKIII